MSNALLRLREMSKSFSSTEREVAENILKDPSMVVDLSIHQLAKTTFSSASTIVRLCNHIGYTGYKEFRRAVTYELAQRDQTRKTDRTEIGQTDSIADIIHKITYQNILSLEETRELLDVQVLKEAVELLRRARVIYLFGLGASLCAAKDAYLKFLRLNRLAVINDDWHSQLLQAKNATSEDLALVISYSGATEEIIACIKELKNNNTPVVAITRCVPSPVSEMADLKLYTAANESLFRSGAMASRMSQLNIVDILYTALANEAYSDSMGQLARTHIHKPDFFQTKSGK